MCIIIMCCLMLGRVGYPFHSALPFHLLSSGLSIMKHLCHYLHRLFSRSGSYIFLSIILFSSYHVVLFSVFSSHGKYLCLSSSYCNNRFCRFCYIEDRFIFLSMRCGAFFSRAVISLTSSFSCVWFVCLFVFFLSMPHIRALTLVLNSIQGLFALFQLIMYWFVTIFSSGFSVLLVL